MEILGGLAVFPGAATTRYLRTKPRVDVCKIEHIKLGAIETFIVEQNYSDKAGSFDDVRNLAEGLGDGGAIAYYEFSPFLILIRNS